MPARTPDARAKTKRPRVFNAWFLGRPEIVDFGGLGGPGSPKNHSRRWGAKPPTFWNGLWGRWGRPNPKNLRFPACPKNHVLKTHVCTSASAVKHSFVLASCVPFVCSLLMPPARPDEESEEVIPAVLKNIFNFLGA